MRVIVVVTLNSPLSSFGSSVSRRVARVRDCFLLPFDLEVCGFG